MLMEFRNDRIMDMLKTVYPLKLRFAEGYNKENGNVRICFVFSYQWCLR